MSLHMIHHVDLKTKTKQALLSHIHSMNLSLDNKLPREEQLCQMLGVSRVTLRSVLDELAAEGVILRRQGKGTFVNLTSIAINAPLNPAMHMGDIIARSGYSPHVHTVGWQVLPATPEFASRLEIPEAAPCISTKRMFYADSRPCVYCDDIMPASIWDDDCLPPDSQDSIFQLIYKRYGRKISWDKVELQACTSDALPDLHVFGQRPLLLLKSVIYDTNNVPLLLTSEYIDTELLTFSQIRQREFSYTTESD